MKAQRGQGSPILVVMDWTKCMNTLGSVDNIQIFQRLEMIPELEKSMNTWISNIQGRHPGRAVNIYMTEWIGPKSRSAQSFFNGPPGTFKSKQRIKIMNCSEGLHTTYGIMHKLSSLDPLWTHLRAWFFNFNISWITSQNLGLSKLLFCTNTLDIPLRLPHSKPLPLFNRMLAENDMSDVSISTPSLSNHSIMFGLVTCN